MLGQPAWAALAGGALALLYLGLEALTWRRARDRDDLALGLAVGGMFVRLVVVFVVLVIIGLVARPAFATAALSFVTCFTAHLVLRPLTFVAPARPTDHVGAG